jgi:hypothetical protein
MGKGASLGKEAVLADSGRAGEKSDFFQHPANREGDGLWSVNRAETETAAVADGFFNADGLADFVLIKGRSISKMSGC